MMFSNRLPITIQSTMKAVDASASRGCSRVILILLSAILLTGCQIGYIVKSGYNQMSLLASREPVERSLKRTDLTEEEKRKIRLANEAREFAETHLKLKNTKNYSSFVKLNRPYLTYVVSAAPKWELKAHQWSYPLVGKMPYKGYFSEADAQAEEKVLAATGLDTYLRGVSAYSTLGWFSDPLVSPMLRYKDHHLVNTVIHETVHATLYIKNSADFNERLAVFIGNLGTEMFYFQKEGPDSETVKQIKKENQDERLFSEFITQELRELEEWYKKISSDEKKEEVRMQRIAEIKVNYEKKLKPRLHQPMKGFEQAALNNARLMVYRTYMQDLSDFQKLYDQLGMDMQAFLKACSSLEKSKNPEQDLKKMTALPEN